MRSKWRFFFHINPQISIWVLIFIMHLLNSCIHRNKLSLSSYLYHEKERFSWILSLGYFIFQAFKREACWDCYLLLEISFQFDQRHVWVAAWTIIYLILTLSLREGNLSPYDISKTIIRLDYILKFIVRKQEAAHPPKLSQIKLSKRRWLQPYESIGNDCPSGSFSTISF